MGVPTGRALAWLLAVVAAVVTGLRWVDVAASPVVLVQSLNPLAAVLALVALCGALLPGHRRGRVGLVGLSVLVLGVHAAIWAPWLTAEQPRPGRAVTVMTVNLYVGRADAAAVGRIVRAHSVDVLVLSEVRRDARDDLSGALARLPHAVPTRPTGGSTVIRSRLPVTPVPDPPEQFSATDSRRNPAGRLRVGGTEITLRAVHPSPPTGARIDRWRVTLDALSGWAGQVRGPLVVAGDFNSSVDHPAMRALLAAGLRDAHEVAGAGRPPTWPRGRSVPPFVHIDHVLVRGLDVGSAQEVRIPRSDHDAVLVDLVVPAGR
ncbi:MAG: endonuclease/exonuclease/phosphatase family protein [Actinomycetota bacterium]|nr:endonuclease/exonuclease/phosphatase family protein [Actinomycetota bacterium]